MSDKQFENKPQTTSTWKLKALIALQSVILIILVAGIAYGSYSFYIYYTDQKKLTEEKEQRISKLESERDISIVDQEKRINDLTKTNQDQKDQIDRLQIDLNNANATIEKLRPKDIKEYKYKDNIKINTSRGDVWLDPIYVDMNADGKNEGVFSYKVGGTGEFLNVYVFTYIENNLTQILKAEEYYKGVVNYLPEESVLEIRSQSGTPDAPVQVSSRFKWDATTKKLNKI